MRLSKFKKVPYVRLAIDLNDLRTHPAPYHQKVILATDSRSCKLGDMWQVRPIGFSWNMKVVYIVCPYCGEIHSHTNSYGHRVSHCRRYEIRKRGV